MPKLKIDLVVDDKGTVVIRNFGKDVVTVMNKSQAQFLKSSAKMAAGFAAVAGAAGLAALTYGLKESIRAASDLEEVSGKFGVVFGDQLGQAEEWATELVDGYAMSTREAKQYLSSVQDILVPMGMQSDAAGKMSSEMVKLAADLGSFNNLPTAKVMDDMMSATVGNYETMKKYGVVLSATIVEQKALEMGLAASKKELNSSMKAQAAYALMVESSTAAIGDMARTADSAANQEKLFLAIKEDLLAVIGEGLLPYYSKLLKVMNTWGSELLDNKEYLQELTHDGIMLVVKGLGLAIETVRFFHNGWLGLKLAGTGAVAAIAFGIDELMKSIRMLLFPLDLFIAGLVELGTIDRNPFDALEESLSEFRSAASMMHEDVIDETMQVNAGYDSWKQKIIDIQAELSKVPAQMATSGFQDVQSLTSGKKQLASDKTLLQGRLDEYLKFYQKLGKEIEQHAAKEAKTIKELNDLYRQQMDIRRSTEDMIAELGGEARTAAEQYSLTRTELAQQFEAAQMLNGQAQVDALEKYKQAVNSLAQEFQEGAGSTQGSEVTTQAISDIQRAYEIQKEVMAGLTTATQEQIETNRLWGDELQAEAEKAATGIAELEGLIFDLDTQLAALDTVMALDADDRASSVIQQVKDQVDALHDKTITITTIYQGVNAGGASAAGTGSTQAYADGGWINEPVVGVGMNSGSRYTFGERESELVVPKSKMNSGSAGGGASFGDININIPPGAAPQSPTDYRQITRDFIWPEIRERLRHG